MGEERRRRKEEAREMDYPTLAKLIYANP